VYVDQSTPVDDLPELDDQPLEFVTSELFSLAGVNPSVKFISSPTQVVLFHVSTAR